MLKKGSTVLGQLKDFSPDSQVNTSDEGRLSDSTVYVDRSSDKHNVNFQLYVDDTYKEVAALLGYTLNPATGWVGNETIGLNPDIAAADYTVEVYNNTSATAVLQGTHYINDWVPITQSMPVSDGQGSVVVTINGVAEGGLYYTPAAGIGST